jgi:hypothetical protein
VNATSRNKIQLLFSEGCPGGEAPAEILHEILSEMSHEAGLELVKMSVQEFGDLGTPGSPTILVNGFDLFPLDTAGPTTASCCRLYATPEGIKSHPTAGMVREALNGSINASR